MKITLKRIGKMKLEQEEIEALLKAMQILYRVSEDIDTISEVLTPGYLDIGNNAWEAAEKIKRFLSDICVKVEEMP